ncbi:MAG: hypothetical protein A2463_05005 [Candidatus Staskawiczbacteria bacterium RIFOXYC2_FULL_32_10]|nr:MAG: hypothetical protein A2463_05005 [Candidatus Staskawiczbacteria bacterium RIFOXYC2_FULL_32_10]
MDGREIVSQQQRVVEMAKRDGYFAEVKLSIPYPDRKADEDSVMAWTKMAPKSMDKIFADAYRN